MAIFLTLLRKLLTEKEEVASASQAPLSPLNDHPKPTTGGKKGGKREGGREAGREGRRKEGGTETN